MKAQPRKLDSYLGQFENHGAPERFLCSGKFIYSLYSRIWILSEAIGCRSTASRPVVTDSGGMKIIGMWSLFFLELLKLVSSPEHFVQRIVERRNWSLWNLISQNGKLHEFPASGSTIVIFVYCFWLKKLISEVCRQDFYGRQEQHYLSWVEG